MTPATPNEWDYADVPTDEPDPTPRNQAQPGVPWLAVGAGALVGICLALGAFFLLFDDDADVDTVGQDEDEAEAEPHGSVTSSPGAIGTAPPDAVGAPVPPVPDTGPCESDFDCYTQAVANGEQPSIGLIEAALGADVEGGPCDDGDECVVGLVGVVGFIGAEYAGGPVAVPWECYADGDELISDSEASFVGPQPDDRGVFVIEEACTHEFTSGGELGGNSVFVEMPFDLRSNRVSLGAPGIPLDELAATYPDQPTTGGSTP